MTDFQIAVLKWLELIAKGIFIIIANNCPIESVNRFLTLVEEMKPEAK